VRPSWITLKRSSNKKPSATGTSGMERATYRRVNPRELTEVGERQP